MQSVSESGFEKEWVWSIRWEKKRIKSRNKWKIKNEEQNSKIKENAIN